MTLFNCAFCAAPIRSAESEVRCPRCRENQPVPERPAFFHEFSEAQLGVIRDRMEQARRNDRRLDPAVQTALEDGRRDALEEMHLYDSELLHALEEDIFMILMHGYLVGRASLGTSSKRLVAAEGHESELPWRLREKANTLLQNGVFTRLDPVTQYCLWQAFNQWLNFEYHERNLQDETATLVSRIQEWVKLGYLLALAEDALAEDKPERPPTTHLVRSHYSKPAEQVIECETVELERDGTERSYGIRFYDALGREIPRDPHLSFGPLEATSDGRCLRRHRLNLTAFVHEHGSLIAKVHQIGRDGTKVVYSDLDAGARPLLDFFAIFGAQI